MDEVNRYDGLLLVNEYGNLYLYNFEGQNISFKLEKFKKNYWRKKDTTKSVKVTDRKHGKTQTASVSTSFPASFSS